MVERVDKGQMEKKHPTPEQLSAFVAGFLGGEELTQVVEHLRTCEDCHKVIEGSARIDRESGGGNDEETIH